MAQERRPRRSQLERMFEQHGRAISQYTGKPHFVGVIETIYNLAEDPVVPPAVRQKACETIMKYGIGLPVQRVDMTTQGGRLTYPPIQVMTSSTMAEAAVNQISSGIEPKEPDDADEDD